MTCHVCANPTCLDDCTNFPPPPLKLGSAEHKLQELLKIADSMVDDHMVEVDGFYYCNHCSREYIYKNGSRTVTHHETCPILKLEIFKASL